MFSNRLEMLIESFLGRLVIKRPNNKNAVGADFFSKFVHVEGLGRIIGSSPNDDRSSSVKLLDNSRKQFLFLIIGQGWRFTACTSDENGVRTMIDKPGSKFGSSFSIEGSIFVEKRNHCSNKASKIGLHETILLPGLQMRCEGRKPRSSRRVLR